MGAWWLAGVPVRKVVSQALRVSGREVGRVDCLYVCGPAGCAGWLWSPALTADAGSPIRFDIIQNNCAGLESADITSVDSE